MSNENKLKARDLQTKSPEELTKILHELRKEQFNLRMAQGSESKIKPHLFKLVRRNIARVKTVLSSK